MGGKSEMSEIDVVVVVVVLRRQFFISFNYRKCGYTVGVGNARENLLGTFIGMLFSLLW